MIKKPGSGRFPVGGASETGGMNETGVARDRREEQGRRGAGATGQATNVAQSR